MPTYTAIAFENLLEPRVRKSHGKLNERNDEEQVVADVESEPVSEPVNHIYISPALYITPEPAPIPETSSGSMSPSPYLVNHKRRGGGEAFANRKLDGLEEVEQVDEKTDLDLHLNLEEEPAEDNLFEEDEGFLDPRCDALSIGSVNEVKGLDCRSCVSAQGEFFDADEDFQSLEGSSLNGSTYEPNIESDLCATRLKLLEEIEKRKTAEDALNMMQCQWQKICSVLSQAGLTLPSPSDVIGGIQLDNASIEQLSQEVVVTRFVAEAIGKGQARAEAELAAESILESKNQEISRLRDRLRYYEVVNHEMSQRNQEIIEVARKQRQRKRTQKKWLWSCIGLSAAIGVSVVAYKHLPQTSKHQPISYASESTGAGTHKTT
ncbi:putative NADPH:adrenodoxin oxidoreductase, mitochondrial-like isoform X1 [Capsicum annuum]|uniref:uncharacterized protein LOC107839771 n=1 Tax=Capsicum annuum TaxID=4072 RepID=UPI0007BFACEF|nr:uncharacterized protein LOC107839771 [Capsicum annuum]KAF3614402.1 putative NADPH:adrenodoxin oxidoreductase, mitochondrial-like isoform X1 [Capsicum annuum]KAF3631529.1 putative NADPH:adrenodoxin oxidoreductase, mitochondrial-like isoform X1 [Capsicum annuum]